MKESFLTFLGDRNPSGTTPSTRGGGGRVDPQVSQEQQMLQT